MEYFIERPNDRLLTPLTPGRLYSLKQSGRFVCYTPNGRMDDTRVFAAGAIFMCLGLAEEVAYRQPKELVLGPDGITYSYYAFFSPEQRDGWFRPVTPEK